MGNLLKFPARIRPQLGYYFQYCNSREDYRYCSIIVLFALGGWYKTPQAKRMELPSSDHLNYFQKKQRYGRNKDANRKDKCCFRCRREGHPARDKSCPARSAISRRCQNGGHFAVVCKSKMNTQTGMKGGNFKGKNVLEK